MGPVAQEFHVAVGCREPKRHNQLILALFKWPDDKRSTFVEHRHFAVIRLPEQIRLERHGAGRHVRMDKFYVANAVAEALLWCLGVF